MKKILIIFVLVLFTFFTKTETGKTEDLTQAGFTPAPIWFSKYPVFVDDKIKVYTSLYNNSDYDISGEVYFFNNEDFIGKSDFNMTAKSGDSDVWINWTAEQGDIVIGAEIKSLIIKDSEGNIVFDINLRDNELIKNKIKIDYKKESEEDLSENENVEATTENESSSEENKEKSEETKNGAEEKNIIDKIDESVMDFLNKITKNKIDETFDILSEEQVSKLEIKKEDLKNKISSSPKESAVKLDTIKTSTSTRDNNSVESNKDESLQSIEKSEAKERVNNFFKDFFYKSYLFLISVLIFFLNHKVFLFLLIFLIVYIMIKKLIRFFID